MEIRKDDDYIVGKICDTAFKILENVGMEFKSERAINRLKASGVKCVGERAYFTKEQIENGVELAKKDFIIYARNEKYNVHMNVDDIYMTPAYGSPFINNVDGSFRNANFKDYIKIASLIQQMDEFQINGGILVQPEDIDPNIAAEVMVYTSLCRSDKALFSVCDGGKQAANIMKMLKVVFGEDLTDKPCSINLISTFSPLSITDNAIDTMEICAENGQPLVIAPAPMAGSTGPISLAGNVALATAEFLGANYYAQIVRPGTPVIYGFAATVSNVRSGNVSNACPGFVKEARYGALVSKHFGFPCRSGGGMSDAGGLTAQAGVESSISMFESFSMKANLMMHACGSLDSFNAVSIEKLVLDAETFGRLKYYFSDLDYSDDALAYDDIKDTIENNSNFLVSMHTFRRCRIDPWISQVSLHGIAHDEPNHELYASILKRIDKLEKSYAIPVLDSTVRNKLNDIILGVGMKESDMLLV